MYLSFCESLGTKTFKRQYLFLVGNIFCLSIFGKKLDCYVFLVANIYWFVLVFGW